MSEGSPVSPVFATPEALAEWMCSAERDRFDRASSYDGALRWITGPGWSMSMIDSGQGVQPGVAAMTSGDR